MTSDQLARIESVLVHYAAFAPREIHLVAPRRNALIIANDTGVQFPSLRSIGILYALVLLDRARGYRAICFAQDGATLTTATLAKLVADALKLPALSLHSFSFGQLALTCRIACNGDLERLSAFVAVPADAACSIEDYCAKRASEAATSSYPRVPCAPALPHPALLDVATFFPEALDQLFVDLLRRSVETTKSGADPFNDGVRARLDLYSRELLHNDVGERLANINANPCLPLFLAALANERIRARMFPESSSDGSNTVTRNKHLLLPAQYWLVWLYALMRHYVALYACRDNLALDFLAGTQNPLFHNRLLLPYPRFEAIVAYDSNVDDEDDAQDLARHRSSDFSNCFTRSLSTSAVSAPEPLFSYAQPHVWSVRIGKKERWREMPSLAVANASCAANCGAPATVVVFHYDDEATLYVLCHETALDACIQHYRSHPPEASSQLLIGISTPVEQQRVCRQRILLSVRDYDTVERLMAVLNGSNGDAAVTMQWMAAPHERVPALDMQRPDDTTLVALAWNTPSQLWASAKLMTQSCQRVLAATKLIRSAHVTVHQPGELWPLFGDTPLATMLFPLRIECGAREIHARTSVLDDDSVLPTEGVFRCGRSGASQRLDVWRVYENDNKRALAYDAMHTSAHTHTAAPSMLFCVRPATMLLPLVEFNQYDASNAALLQTNSTNNACNTLCPFGCSECHITLPPLCRNGMALCTRAQLATALCWQWLAFAERALLDHKRASQLSTGSRSWLVTQSLQAHNTLYNAMRHRQEGTKISSGGSGSSSLSASRDTMPMAIDGDAVDEALVPDATELLRRQKSARKRTLSSSTLSTDSTLSSSDSNDSSSASGSPSSSDSGRTKFENTVVALNERESWNVPYTISQSAVRKRLNVPELVAHVVFMLWHFQDAVTYASWIGVGLSLREIDLYADQLELVYRWWSKRYGKDAYKDADWVDKKRVWLKLKKTLSPLRALSGLASRVKSTKKSLKQTDVDHIMKTFGEECERWFLAK